MNWTETLIGAGAVGASGMMIAREYSDRFIVGVGETLAPQSVSATASLVTIGGVSMTPTDLVVMALLTAASAGVAAGVRFRNWRAAAINFVLGVVFGVVFAHLAVVMLQLDHGALFGLAPAMALIAAKISRALIHDDKIVTEALAALGRWLSGLFGKKDGGGA